MLGNKRRWKSRGSESELLPSTPCAAAAKNKSKKTDGEEEEEEAETGRGWWRQRNGEREGCEKKTAETERKNPGPCFVYFFFKQWHPVFLDVSLPWQL